MPTGTGYSPPILLPSTRWRARDDRSSGLHTNSTPEAPRIPQGAPTPTAPPKVEGPFMCSRSSSAEFSDPGGVRVLLERCGLAIAKGPDVGRLHRGRRARVLVLPREVPERHDGVAVGDELLGRHREVVA